MPVATAPKVLEPAAREANKAEKAKLASGMLGLDTYNMREPLRQAGLRFID